MEFPNYNEDNIRVLLTKSEDKLEIKIISLIIVLLIAILFICFYPIDHYKKYLAIVTCEKNNCYLTVSSSPLENQFLTKDNFIWIDDKYKITKVIYEQPVMLENMQIRQQVTVIFMVKEKKESLGKEIFDFLKGGE